METIARKPVPAPAVNPVEETSQAEEGTTASVNWEGEAQDQRKEKPPPLAAGDHSNLRQRLDARIDKILPPHRKYGGLSRRSACLVVTGVLLIFLALIIGLSIGLSMRNGCVHPFLQLIRANGSADIRCRNRHLKLPLGSQTYAGDLTYYGTGLSACGVVAHDNDDIVSISHYTFDAVSKNSNPNANPLCGHKIRAVRDGNSVDLTVVDRCKSRHPEYYQSCD